MISTFRRALGLVAGLALSATASADTIVVQLINFEFVPRDIVITVGDTVSWQNVEGFHTVTEGTSAMQGGAFNEVVDPFFPQFDLVFDQAFLDANPRPGDLYDYFCIPHDFVGMAGTIQVNPAGTTCDDGDTPGNYCQANPFSTGSASTISANTDSVSIAANDLVLMADNLPSTPPQPGQFIAAQAAFQNPFMNGFLCVEPGSLQRLTPISFPDNTGVAMISVDFVSGAQTPGGGGPVNVVAGTTHYFQRWNRDPGVGSGSNLSDGIAICITP